MFVKIPKGKLTEEEAELISAGILNVLTFSGIIVPKWSNFKVVNALGDITINFSGDLESFLLTTVSGKFDRANTTGEIGFEDFNPKSYSGGYSVELLENLQGYLKQALEGKLEETQLTIKCVNELLKPLQNKQKNQAS